MKLITKIKIKGGKESVKKTIKNDNHTKFSISLHRPQSSEMRKL